MLHTITPGYGFFAADSFTIVVTSINASLRPLGQQCTLQFISGRSANVSVTPFTDSGNMKIGYLNLCIMKKKSMIDIPRIPSSRPWQIYYGSRQTWFSISALPVTVSSEPQQSSTNLPARRPSAPNMCRQWYALLRMQNIYFGTICIVCSYPVVTADSIVVLLIIFVGNDTMEARKVEIYIKGLYARNLKHSTSVFFVLARRWIH